jgi:hypothetical protein
MRGVARLGARGGAPACAGSKPDRSYRLDAPGLGITFIGVDFTSLAIALRTVPGWYRASSAIVAVEHHAIPTASVCVAIVTNTTRAARPTPVTFCAAYTCR